MDLIEQALAEGVHGYLHPDELRALMALAAGGRVLEVGSFRGLSAWGMAQTARSLVCVDTFRADPGGQVQMPEHTTLADFLAATARFQNVTAFIGTSEQAADALSDSGWDLVFVDAMHDYDNVAADIRRWWPRIKTGGSLALHDYNPGGFPGVVRASDEAFGPPGPGDIVHTLRVVRRT